jgi:hypothetical protein
MRQSPDPAPVVEVSWRMTPDCHTKISSLWSGLPPVKSDVESKQIVEPSELMSG